MRYAHFCDSRIRCYEFVGIRAFQNRGTRGMIRAKSSSPRNIAGYVQYYFPPDEQAISLCDVLNVQK